MSLKVEKASSEPETWFVTPIPGYVVKFKEVKMSGLGEEGEKRKCFVNVCHCSQLPPPVDDLDEDALAARIDSSDLTFRVPLSIGELDCVRDNKNENSVKIDVLVNSVFFEKRLAPADAEFYRHFVLMVICEAIEKKHMLQLDPNTATRLQNRKKMGEIEPMRIAKRPPAPVIREIEAEGEGVKKGKVEGAARVEEIPEEEEVNPYLTFPQPDGVLLRVLKGSRLEARLDLSSVEGQLSPERLRLRVKSDRIMLLLDNSRSLFDFHLPVLLNTSTLRSRLFIEKQRLVVSAELFFP